MNIDDFAHKDLDRYDNLQKKLREPQYSNKWAFRGQLSKWPLETSFTRSCMKSNYCGEERAKIEYEMLRNFKRVYDGPDKNTVNCDTLYCLSLMQHYGAPTRLLDFTYSPYVAMYFALQYVYDNINEYKESENLTCSVWCINTDWLTKAAKKSKQNGDKCHIRLIEERPLRAEISFKQLHMENKYRLVYWENPLTIHSRLHLHHGLFLCSGDIKRSFQDNIINLSGWNKETSILKINCTMELEDLRDGLEECRRMNLTRESLFPGLDGFSQAMNYQLSFYHSMWQNRNEIILSFWFTN